MCLPCLPCFRYHDVILKPPPEQEPVEYFFVDDNTEFYPANAYAQIAPAQVSTTNPHWHCFPSQPTSTGPVTNPTYGKTTAEVLRDNIALAERSGANKPREFVPYNTKPGQLLWCKELDGSFSLRTTTECMEELQPGSWFQTPEGKPFFVRRSK